jgi:hypothetical protein
MKKIIICVMAAFLSLTFLPLQSNAATSEPASTLVAPDPAVAAEIKNLELRLSEINAMDKSEMKAAEKKSLRKEVKTINHKLRDISGGVYVSAGAIIIVLILLIVLL